MRKWLSFLGAITLLGTSTTSLVACNNIPQYNEEELQQLKKENQICTNCQEIKENLEWICPQEKPFNQVDNKYYYVVWQGDKNNDWRIIKFKNTEKIRLKGGNKLVLDYYGRVDDPNKINLVFDAKIINLRANDQIWTDNSINFKSVYRWNGDEQKLPYLVVDSCGDVKVNRE
ncbi:lipoprotein [Spiroplasma citri]|uniref:Lipoprotein n=1 Tax=Spiroplasma citri TaxID=2133 RepID=A0AAX3T0Q6_SPICI|nr:lipoprotein [Spiroplasma citri]WFG97190.1 lipoprotein [Spiroplasma citri]